MDIIASVVGFVVIGVMAYWVVRSRREAINTRLELDKLRRLREALDEADEKKRQ